MSEVLEVRRAVYVAASEQENIHCMQCQRKLADDRIALLVRCDKTEPFIAWCPACTRYLLTLVLDALTPFEVTFTL